MGSCVSSLPTGLGPERQRFAVDVSFLARTSPTRSPVGAYFRMHPDGEQVTLHVLDGLGRTLIDGIARATRGTRGTVKQAIGLRVPILLAQMAGPDNVATLRDPGTMKCSTRMRTANWPDLAWVSRYTPHVVSPKAVARVLASE